MNHHLIKPMNEEYREYLRDESRTIGHASSISFPKSEGEVAQILTALYTKGIPVTIQGARTGLAAGAVPHEGHIMNLSRLDRVTGMRQDQQGDYYMTMESGAILSQLRKKIESKRFELADWDESSKRAFEAFSEDKNYFFSPDPTESSATIGGMVACNASGARSYLYGPTRNHISALRIVMYDGQILALRRGEVFSSNRTLALTTESGKRVEVALPTYQMPNTKNASGYFIEDDMDAIDLFIGSDGTLGIVTEVEVKLLPLPDTIWGISCFFEEEIQALDFVETVRSNMASVASMEYFDGDALNILRHQKENNPGFAKLQPIPQCANTTIYLELHCQDDAAAIAGLTEIGLHMKASGGCEKNTWVARNDADRDSLYFFRHAVPESVNMVIDHRKKENPMITKLGTDMSVPNQHLKHIVKMYHTMLAERGLQSAIWGHIGENHLHVNILPRDDQDYLKGKALYDEWAQEVTRLGGAVSAEHGVGKLKAKYLGVMYGPDYIREMATLKYQFDPKGLLGAGNMFEPIQGDDRR
jgi:D-lactate dehydrogenase (cytochrome)